MSRQVTKQDYFDWAATEPLSDVGVDMENVGDDTNRDDYWTRMLEAGKDAVELRKMERITAELHAKMSRPYGSIEE